MLEPELYRFVGTSITSLWALEMLTLLHGNGSQPVSRGQLVRDLRGTPRLIRTLLDELASAGLVELDGRGARFRPRTRRLGELSAALIKANLERPLAVRTAIAMTRVNLGGLPDTVPTGRMGN